MKFLLKSLVLACFLLVSQSCKSSDAAIRYFTPHVYAQEEVVNIPVEGGDYYFVASFEQVQTKAESERMYKPFRYRVNIGDVTGGAEVILDGQELYKSWPNSIPRPEIPEFHWSVYFNVPANDEDTERIIKVEVSIDNNYYGQGEHDWGAWETVFEGVQATDGNNRPDTPGDTWEKAEDAVYNMRVGWNLGNTLDSYGDWISQWGDGSTESYETAWGQPVTTPELLQMFAEAGFGAIRVPVTWSQHMDPVTHAVDEDWMKRVEEVVNYVLDTGMYCILNVHHDTGTDGWMHADADTYGATSERFIALWEQIAERFIEYDHKLLFEGYNELLDGNNTWNSPSDPDAFDYANAYNQDFVETVRSTGGNNLYRNLVVNTYAASTDKPALNGFVVPDDSAQDHLIAQVHSYAPYYFAFDVSEDQYWGQYETSDFTEKEENEVRRIIQVVGDHFKSLDLPWILGEYGGTYKNNESEQAEQAAAYVSETTKYGMCTFYWMALSDGEDRNVPKWSRPLIKDAILQNCRK